MLLRLVMTVLLVGLLAPRAPDLGLGRPPLLAGLETRRLAVLEGLARVQADIRQARTVRAAIPG